jgi:hypothetical protein
MINNKNNPSREVILRSTQLDNDTLQILQHKLLTLIESISHYYPIDVNSDKVEIISNFLFNYSSYYLCLKESSPGEEYSGIRKIFKKNNALKYIVFLSIQKMIIKFIHGLIEKRVSYSQNNNQPKLNGFSMKFQIIKNILLKFLNKNFPTFEEVITKIDEFQFCYFFINGKFYDFAQKIFSVRFKNIIAGQKNNSVEIIDSTGFKILGFLTFGKIILEILIGLKNLYKTYQEENKKLIDGNNNKGTSNPGNNFGVNKLNIKLKGTKSHQKNDKSTDAERTCLLCLEERTETSVTLCGHLFCWKCIIHYLQTNPSCPFCRKECQPQNVIYLQNYN